MPQKLAVERPVGHEASPAQEQAGRRRASQGEVLRGVGLATDVEVERTGCTRGAAPRKRRGCGNHQAIRLDGVPASGATQHDAALD